MSREGLEESERSSSSVLEEMPSLWKPGPCLGDMPAANISLKKDKKIPASLSYSVSNLAELQSLWARDPKKCTGINNSSFTEHLTKSWLCV